MILMASSQVQGSAQNSTPTISSTPALNSVITNACLRFILFLIKLYTVCFIRTIALEEMLVFDARIHILVLLEAC